MASLKGDIISPPGPPGNGSNGLSRLPDVVVSGFGWMEISFFSGVFVAGIWRDLGGGWRGALFGPCSGAAVFGSVLVGGVAVSVTSVLGETPPPTGGLGDTPPPIGAGLPGEDFVSDGLLFLFFCPRRANV